MSSICTREFAPLRKVRKQDTWDCCLFCPNPPNSNKGSQNADARSEIADEVTQSSLTSREPFYSSRGRAKQPLTKELIVVQSFLDIGWEARSLKQRERKQSLSNKQWINLQTRYGRAKIGTTQKKTQTKAGERSYQKIENCLLFPNPQEYK